MQKNKTWKENSLKFKRQECKDLKCKGLKVNDLKVLNDLKYCKVD